MFTEEQTKLLREFAGTLTVGDMIGVLFVTGILATLADFAVSNHAAGAADADDAPAIEGAPV